jgi:hypothetical protein
MIAIRSITQRGNDMLGVLIDAAVLIGLLKLINDDDMDLRTAFIVALVASLGVWVLALGLGYLIGFAGVVLAALLAAAILGASLSYMFGMEIKRALIVAACFVVVSVGARIGLQLMLGGFTETKTEALDDSSRHGEIVAVAFDRE